MEMGTDEVGKRIRDVRKQKGLTQAYVASSAGIAVNSLRLYEAGKRKPNIETLHKISVALLVPMTDLLDKTAESAYQAGIDIGSEMEEWQNNIIEELRKQEGYSFSDDESRLIGAFSKLNTDGQQKAVERVEELTEIPKYKK